MYEEKFLILTGKALATPFTLDFTKTKRPEFEFKEDFFGLSSSPCIPVNYELQDFAKRRLFENSTESSIITSLGEETRFAASPIKWLSGIDEKHGIGRYIISSIYPKAENMHEGKNIFELIYTKEDPHSVELFSEFPMIKHDIYVTSKQLWIKGYFDFELLSKM